jgi:hypothetical protein
VSTSGRGGERPIAKIRMVLPNPGVTAETRMNAFNNNSADPTCPTPAESRTDADGRTAAPHLLAGSTRLFTRPPQPRTRPPTHTDQAFSHLFRPYRPSFCSVGLSALSAS